jgi:hypothetical protein
MREEEGVGGVIKLISIVTLDTPHGTTKLCGHIGEKVGKGGKHVRLMARSSCLLPQLDRLSKDEKLNSCEAWTPRHEIVIAKI